MKGKFNRVGTVCSTQFAVVAIRFVARVKA